jgi:hypothetical protein
MQNKPNFSRAEMNVTAFITKDYENLRLFRHGKNKPNQTQFWLCNSQTLAVKWLTKYIFLCLPFVTQRRRVAKKQKE